MLGDLAGRHRGLANMAARTEELGGEFRIRRSRLGVIRIAVDLPTGPTPHVFAVHKQEVL